MATTKTQDGRESQAQAQDVTGQPQVKRQELVKALAAVNRYILADEPNLSNGVGASQAEVDRMCAAQRECVQVLCGIDDPLVQAIAARLNLEKTHTNVRQLIRKLADRAAA